MRTIYHLLSRHGRDGVPDRRVRRPVRRHTIAAGWVAACGFGGNPFAIRKNRTYRRVNGDARYVGANVLFGRPYFWLRLFFRARRSKPAQSWRDAFMCERILCRGISADEEKSA